MPPKKNIKNTTLKQKQNKAKQQQQQQQGQNVKININVGDKPSKRKPRTTRPKQPPKQPPKPPPQLPTPQVQYVPMHLVQQPATYFTPPVSAPPIVAPPTTTITPIVAPPIVAPPIGPPVGPPIGPPVGPPVGPPRLRRARTGPITTPSGPPIITPPTIRTGTGPPIVPMNPLLNLPSIELNTFENFTPRQNVISNLISYEDLDEPMAYSFSDYTDTYSNVYDWIQQGIENFNDSQTQTDFMPQIGSFMPLTQDIIPSAISDTLMKNEMQNIPQPPLLPPKSKLVPQPPPLPQAQPPPPPPLRDFLAPTQDIQQSGITRLVDLTQENLQQLGGITSNEEYAPSEISEITEGTSRSIYTDITNATKNLYEKPKQMNVLEMIQQKAKEQQEKNKKPIDEILKENKEKQSKDEGLASTIFAEMEKRRQFIQPPDEEDTSDDWEEELEYTTKKQEPEPDQPRKPIAEGKKMTRKPGSGRPKGSRNKSQTERDLDDSLERTKERLRETKRKMKALERSKIDTDEEDNTVEDYIQMINNLENQIVFINGLIQDERELRRLKPIEEYGFEGEEEDDEEN
jgi:hypothetical protein